MTIRRRPVIYIGPTTGQPITATSYVPIYGLTIYFLTSTTITGLQVMIDVCTDYVEAHGLNFNGSTTNWTIKGKPPFTSEATLMLNGTTLTKENAIKYLGTILGNVGSATHVAQRIKAANGSYFKLQAAGMHGGGLSPDAISEGMRRNHVKVSSDHNIE